jgi:hypothetical protein
MVTMVRLLVINPKGQWFKLRHRQMFDFLSPDIEKATDLWNLHCFGSIHSLLEQITCNRLIDADG